MGLAPFIDFKSSISRPFQCWAPPLLTPEEPTRDKYFKRLSDVVEAVLGGFLLDSGPEAANAFLR